MSLDDLQFSIFDEPTEGRQSYALPPQEWDRMALLANHLAERDAISPLKRRMRTFLGEANRASLMQRKA
jgi:hypothetical protein